MTCAACNCCFAVPPVRAIDLFGTQRALTLNSSVLDEFTLEGVPQPSYHQQSCQSRQVFTSTSQLGIKRTHLFCCLHSALWIFTRYSAHLWSKVYRLIRVIKGAIDHRRVDLIPTPKTFELAHWITSRRSCFFALPVPGLPLAHIVLTFIWCFPKLEICISWTWK